MSSHSITLAQLYSLFLECKGVSTDTRHITKGQMFFALKGEHFNGNLYAQNALEKGAKYAIVDEPEYADGNQIFCVENGLNSLQALAQHHRRTLNIPVIGLTGSNGKTTTKELIANSLRPKYNVWFTPGNYNNHIGVPLTLLSLNPAHQIAVVEMGANHQGEIKQLAEIAEPNYGYITNFGKAHLEGFGGVEGVIKGKSELYDFLRNHSQKAFVNHDDAKQVEKSEGIERIFFSQSKKTSYAYSKEMNGGFVALKYQGSLLQSQLVGEYNFTNLAAAVTIGLYFGVEWNALKNSLESYIPENNRSQILIKEHCKIILDAYNANPSSMEAALKYFKGLSGEKAVILGDMFELGDDTLTEHKSIAELALSIQAQEVYLIGQHFSNIELPTTEGLFLFKDKDAFLKHLQNQPLSANHILIKGSRGMKLEELVDHL